MWQNKYGKELKGVLAENFKETFPDSIRKIFLNEGLIIQWLNNDVWIMLKEEGD